MSLPLPTKVTVAVPTYNRAAMLRQTLAGIVAQRFPRDHFEILVIDNASTDATRAVVADFASARPIPRYIFEPQQGLDFARNRAIAEAQGEFMVFCDDDVAMRTDWLAQIAVPLLADAGSRRIGAVGGEVVPVFPDGAPDWVRGWHSPLAFRPDVGPLEPRQNPMGANLALPKWIFDELGRFDPHLDRCAGTYFSGGDTEMLRRIRAAGYEVWFAPDAAVQHHLPASRTTFSYAAQHAFDSARSRVIGRANSPDAMGYFAGRLVANCAKALAFSLVAGANTLVLRRGEATKSLVRAWRACGYVYQIPRSLAGRLGRPPLHSA